MAGVDAAATMAELQQATCWADIRDGLNRNLNRDEVKALASAAGVDMASWANKRLPKNQVLDLANQLKFLIPQ